MTRKLGLFLLPLAMLCAHCSTVASGEPAVSPGPKEEEIDPDVLRKVRKTIQGTLSKEEPEREAAWKTLKDMGNLAVPGLVALYRQKVATPEMMRSILIALGESKDPRAGPALVEILASDDKLVRQDAARAIGDSRYKAGAPALEKIAADSRQDEEVRLYAATAGAKLESAACVDALKALLDSARPELRSRAVFALGKYGGIKQVEVVAKALADKDSSVREDAVEALRLLKEKPAWGPLVKATADADYKVRSGAMDALRQLTKKKFGNEPKAWQEWFAQGAKDDPAPQKLDAVPDTDEPEMPGGPGDEE